MKRHLLLALLPLAACNCLENNGNSRSGRFEARLPTLTAGTSYDVQVFDYEFDRSVPTTVSSASASDESIAAVTTREGGTIISIDAKKAGSFALDFTADADGRPLTDAFDVQVIQALRFEMAHLCDATYVANRPAEIEFWFSNGARTRGNGYGWYPVTVSGASLVESLSTAHTLWIALGNSDATITSTLAPENEEPSQLALDVVPISDIDGVAIVDEAHSPVLNGRRIEKDEELAIRVVPALGARALCGARVESKVEVSDDSDCMLASSPGSEQLARSLATGGEAIVVVAVAWGVCQLTATLLGEGLTEVLEFDLSEPPRSSGSSDFD